LRQELQRSAEEKRQVEISLENQVRLKKELQVQVDKLNIFMVQYKDEFERNAEEAKKELRILQEMCGAVPGKEESRQASAQKTFKKVEP
jgi:hypothetical protein